MKNLTTLLLLIPLISFGQLKEIESEKIYGELIGKKTATVQINKLEDHYIFSYRNTKFEYAIDYRSFTLKSTEDFNSFFKVLRNGFNELSKKNKRFQKHLQFEDGLIKLDFILMYGKRVQVSYSGKYNLDVSAWPAMSEKSIHKLFGM